MPVHFVLRGIRVAAAAKIPKPFFNSRPQPFTAYVVESWSSHLENLLSRTEADPVQFLNDNDSH